MIRARVAYTDWEAVKEYRRLVARWCTAQIFKPVVEQGDGLFMSLGTDEIYVYPRVPLVAADEPELQGFYVGMKIGAMSRMPCSVCEVVPSDDGLTGIAPLRDADVMRKLMPKDSWKSVPDGIQHDLKKYFSINVEYNHCWWVPGYNPFRNPGCIIHQFDHGVFDLLLEDTVKFLSQYYPRKTVAEFDLCWEDLMLTPGGKLFRRGVSSLANASCEELRIVSMGLPFALRGVPSESSGTREAGFQPYLLQSVACTYLQLRWLLSLKRLTSRVLDMIQHVSDDLLREMDDLHRAVNDDNPIEHGVKFHKIRHWVQWIQMFGAAENWSTEIWEGAHKLVKRYRSALNWTNPASAPHRVAFLHSIWDVHECIDDSEQSASNKRTRKGLCGFWGRTHLAAIATVGAVAIDYLAWWEGTSERESMSMKEAIAYYLTWSGLVDESNKERMSTILTLLFQ